MVASTQLPRQSCFRSGSIGNDSALLPNCTEHLEAQGGRAPGPNDETCVEVDLTVFNELAQGVFNDKSCARYVEIMNDIEARGTEAVTLSSTEIGLLVPPETAPLPASDSVDALVAAPVEWMLANEPART